ncbi:MAG: RNA 2',3'-cyclic phosphodiesterase [Thermodesulfobacteriota bacterium]
MRIFIAALLPESIRDQITSHINSIKADIKGVKWEKPEKLHLTLNFLGKIQEGKLEQITTMLDNLIDDHDPFQLHLTNFGAFPNLRNPRVLYIGLSENKHLSIFHSKLTKELSELGFEIEERKFTPHITIGRVKNKIRIDSCKDIIQTHFELNRITAIESELNPKGSIYTPLKTFNLGKEL